MKLQTFVLKPFESKKLKDGVETFCINILIHCMKTTQILNSVFYNITTCQTKYKSMQYNNLPNKIQIHVHGELVPIQIDTFFSAFVVIIILMFYVV